MKAEKIETGRSYYYGKSPKKWKCIKTNTSHDASQSNFIDYKGSESQFYNSDMHVDKYKKPCT